MATTDNYSSRVNWGAIFAGALCGTGATFMLTYLARALSFSRLPLAQVSNGNVPIPFTGFDALMAVVFMLAGFAAGGAATSLLGRFTLRLDMMLHAFAAFAVAALANHFLARGALFVGRPGFPFDIALQPELQTGRTFVFGAFVAWVAVFSLFAGAIGCLGGSWMAQNWLAYRRLWPQAGLARTKEVPRRAA